MKVQATSGLDFIKGVRSNVRFDKDNWLTLASRNLLLDPDYQEFTPTARLALWPGMRDPASPVGRNVYAGREGERDFRQNTALLPFSQSSFWQTRDPKTGGAARISVENDFPVPDAPILKNYLWDGDGGYPAGTYAKSYCWILLSLSDPDRWLLSAPAPRVTFNIASGGSFIQPLPPAAPALVPGLAILLTRPDDPTGPLFVNRIADARAGLPEYVVMDGPLRTGIRAANADETYRGAFAALDAPTYDFYPAALDTPQMDCQVSYRVRTAQGLTASQKMVNVVASKRLRGRCARISFPNVGRGALSLIPQLLARDGRWYDLYYDRFGGEIPPGEDVLLLTDDVEALPDFIEAVPSERVRQDASGVPRPDTALPGSKDITDSTIKAGRIRFRATDVYEFEDGRQIDSRPSAPAEITTTAGDIIRVKLAESQVFGNLLPNADYGEKKRSNAPLGYTLASGVTADGNVVAINVSAAGDLFRNDERAPVDATKVHALRAFYELSTLTGGSVDFRLRCYGAASGGSALGTITLGAAISSTGTHEREATIGPSGSGATLTFPSGTTHVELVLFAAAGVARVIGEAYHLALFRGWVVPRKRVGRDPVSAVEDKTRSYPPGNYQVVVKDPSWTEGKGNGIEYYGAANMPLAGGYLPSGLEQPVNPGEVVTVSVHYSVVGGTEGAAIMPLSAHDEEGRSLPVGRPVLVSNASGTHSGRASVTITAPENAAYIRFNPSSLGSGLVRVWGVQFEYGALTDFTRAFEPSGSIRQTFDTAPPGYTDEIGLPEIFRPKKWVEADTVSRTPSGSSVALRFRSRDTKTAPWSSWTTDPEAVLGARYLEVEVTLSASPDLSVSPRLFGIQLVNEPAEAQILRADGTQYHGGILAVDVPATGYPDNTEFGYNSDGSTRIHEAFPAKEEIAFTLYAFTEEGARRLMHDSTHGERRFVLEGWGRKREILMKNIRLGISRRERLLGQDFWLQPSDVITAPVLTSEVIDDD